MANNSDISYFKIGLFVLIGLGLAIAALLIFGSNKLFQKTIYIETYFEESVQGISEGYPVKYRGLSIGYVKKIAFTNEVYNISSSTKAEANRGRSIYILLAITSNLFTHLNQQQIKARLDKEIAAGLRVKIMPQGLTGTTYIELNYVDTKNNSPPVLTWKPKYFYVPSAPGVLTQLSNNMEHIFNELKDVDFKKLFNNLGTLTQSLEQAAQKTNNLLDNTAQPVENTLRNMQDISENLHALSQQLKLYPSQLLFGGQPPPIDPSNL